MKRGSNHAAQYVDIVAADKSAKGQRIKVGTLAGMVILSVMCWITAKWLGAHESLKQGAHVWNQQPPELSQACAYFLSGKKFKEPTCNTSHISRAVRLSAEATRRGGCLPKEIARPDCPLRPSILTTHSWIHTFDLRDDALMLRISVMLRAWTLTQDLRRSRYVFWTSNWHPAPLNTSKLPPWIVQFGPYVSFRLFDYDAEIVGTPLRASRHFDSLERFENATRGALALQSDVFRNVLLHNYGGLWLDYDSVPLRDLWDITAGLGLQFVPKFSRGHSNGHVIYVRCPKSALALRRLATIIKFPYNHPESWPRESPSGLRSWIYNDGLSQQVRVEQALRYNITESTESFDLSRISEMQWEDLEVAFPLSWFDNWWICDRNSTDFARFTACDGTYIWHRLTKHRKGDAGTWGPYSGGDQYWDEIFDGPIHDHKTIRSTWPIEPTVLRGGIDCINTDMNL